MTCLSKLSNILPCLTAPVLKYLRNNYIYSVVHFLKHDLRHLVKITKLPFFEVLNIRRTLITKYIATGVLGTTINHNKLRTRIRKLDSLLKGGIARGKITELCGLAGSGKTQMAFTLCANVALVPGRHAIYIDTQGEFDASRIHEILEARADDVPDIAHSFERIKVMELWNIHDVIRYLHYLRNRDSLMESVDLLVIDSLPSLMLQFMGEKTNQYLGLLNHFVNVTRVLCSKFQICTVVINILTRWSQPNSARGRGSWLASNWTETRTPALGKYWQHVPYLCLELEKAFCVNPEVLNLRIRTQNSLTDVKHIQLLLTEDLGVTSTKNVM